MGKSLERSGEIRIVDEVNVFGLDFFEKTESRLGAPPQTWEQYSCSDSAFYPHKSPSMPPLPPCLTIQLYSSNQLLFPVIIPISSSSIHLLASFTINLPLLFLLDEFGNIISFVSRLYKHVFHFNTLVSHLSTTALIVVSLTPCSLHVKQDSKARIVHVG